MQRTIRIFRASAVSLLIGLTLAACGSAATSDTGTSAVVSATSTLTAASSTQSTPVASAQPGAAASSAPSSSAAASVVAKLNLNTVTEELLLATIPNFSNRMAREFMEYRPYISIQQFRKEIGKYVSAEQVTAWEQYVYVPIDVNQADAATLEQLPSVDATIAAALIAARPYASNDAFLTRLGQSASVEQVAAAAAYLAAQ